MANPVRGEVTVKVGGVEIVMAATMEDMAQLSDALSNPLMMDLMRRLFGMETRAVRAAIGTLTIAGKDATGKPLKAKEAIKAALDAMSYKDTVSLIEGFTTLFAPLLPDDEAVAVEEKKERAPAR